jgi:formylglycine-generating enzyme required for sulfatase activity
MNRNEAFELLGVGPGWDMESIRRRHEELYGEYQIRLTNAPTAALQKLYREKLEALGAARMVLTGVSAVGAHEELPGLAPVREELTAVPVSRRPEAAVGPSSPVAPTELGPRRGPAAAIAAAVVLVAASGWVGWYTATRAARGEAERTDMERAASERARALEASGDSVESEAERSGAAGVDVATSETSRVETAPPVGTDAFVLIPAGSFQMGSSVGGDRPAHTVNITRPFYMQRTEVTQGQWRAVMGSNPSEYSSCGDDCPVENVSWEDVAVFLRRLNTANPGMDYRLPTEAEWEYAARGGATEGFGGTGLLVDMAWYGRNSGGRTHQVGGKVANAWGLYDMQGNVWEWVQDWYSRDYYEMSPPNDPPGPSRGTDRVMRGGSWMSGFLSFDTRQYDSPISRTSSAGFRLARTW